MIEVELIGGAAHDALAAVALPNLKFDVCGDDAAADWMNWNGNVEVFLALHRDKLELENSATCVTFAP